MIALRSVRITVLPLAGSSRRSSQWFDDVMYYCHFSCFPSHFRYPLCKALLSNTGERSARWRTCRFCSLNNGRSDSVDQTVPQVNTQNSARQWSLRLSKVRYFPHLLSLLATEYVYLLFCVVSCHGHANFSYFLRYGLEGCCSFVSVSVQFHLPQTRVLSI